MYLRGYLQERLFEVRFGRIMDGSDSKEQVLRLLFAAFRRHLRWQIILDLSIARTYGIDTQTAWNQLLRKLFAECYHLSHVG